MKRYILVPLKIGSEIVRDILVEGQVYNGGTTARLTNSIVEVEKGDRIERYMVAYRITRELPDEEFVIPYAQPFEVVEKKSHWRCVV